MIVGLCDVQAIRYAAMISAMDFEDIVSAHADYMTRSGRTDVDSRRVLREFLGAAEGEDVAISTKQYEAAHNPAGVVVL